MDSVQEYVRQIVVDKYMEITKNAVYDVIIVGGGVAGITAARHLLSSNVKKILILEAQDYLGGRIKTINTEYGHLDLGAEWIHGQIGNPLYKLAVDNKLAYSRRHSAYISPSSASIYDVHEFRTESGELIERNIVSEVSKVMEDLYDMASSDAPKELEEIIDNISLEDLNDVTRENKSKSKKSVAKSMAKHFNDGFNVYLQNSNGNVNTKQSLFDWRLKWELGDNCCSSLEDVAYPGRYLVYGGHGITDLKYGYQSVLKVIEKDVPEQYVRLCTPVKQIKWHSDSCLVECLNGSVLVTNHVIVTVPIGYLQKHYASLFTPSLPERKIQAIENVGFSSLLKIFVIWDKPFWKESFSGVQFVWNATTIPEELRSKIDEAELHERTKADGNPWYQDITGFERVTGRPNVLCGWLVGEGAVLANNFSDSQLIKTCTSLLHIFCRDQSIPEPDEIYRSHWTSNDYICGGYSYVSTRTKDGDFESLCESLPSNQNPRVLFAGEATSFNYYSTVHGAYQSGIRAAQEVFDVKQKTKL